MRIWIALIFKKGAIFIRIEWTDQTSKVTNMQRFRRKL